MKFLCPLCVICHAQSDIPLTWRVEFSSLLGTRGYVMKSIRWLPLKANHASSSRLALRGQQTEKKQMAREPARRSVDPLYGAGRLQCVVAALSVLSPTESTLASYLIST